MPIITELSPTINGTGIPSETGSVLESDFSGAFSEVHIADTVFVYRKDVTGSSFSFNNISTPAGDDTTSDFLPFGTDTQMTAGDIMLGRRWDGTVATNYVWNGHIACVVAKRNAYFTATEIAQLEGWAAWYYGRVAVLPTGHTYKNAPPLITA